MRFLIVGAALPLLAACGSGKSATSGSSSTTIAVPSQARVVSFSVPASVECHGRTSTTIPVTYVTTGAAQRVLSVDGLAYGATLTPRGLVHPPIHCDGVEHSVALTVGDAAGRTTSAVRYVRTATT